MNCRRVLPMMLIITFACAMLVQHEFGPAQSSFAWAQKEKPAKTELKKPSARLPNNFGKLDLTEMQKDLIRVTLVRYNAQIDVLEEQIRVLKEKRDAEVQKVLSAEQKKKLAALDDDPKKKKSDKPAADMDKDDAE